MTSPAPKHVSRVTQGSKVAPGAGVLLFGLYLDGARWNADKRVLADTLPDERFACLPELYFEPTVVSYYYSFCIKRLVKYLSLLSCFVYATLLFVHLCICELCNVLRDSCLRHKTTRSVVAHYWRFNLFIVFHLID